MTGVAAGLLALMLAAAASPEQPSLLRELRTGTPEERRAAASRLTAVGDAGATDALAGALHDADPEVRALAATALWEIWHRSGSHEIDRLLREGITLMELQRFPEAVVVFTEVINRAPAFAEGWNKRATVYYLMAEYDRSLADCEEVVRRNPIHYGALAGFGLNYLRKDDLARAADYFERALAVNPSLDQVRTVLREIREVLRQRRLNTL